MKVYIKGLNTCTMRKQNLLHYRCFLERTGHQIVSEPREGEAVLVWTCGFRGDVTDNSISELRRYSREYPGEVIALGCLPDIDRELIERNFKGLIVPWKKEGEFLEGYFQAEAGSYSESRPVFYESAICRDAAEHRRQHPNAATTFADQFFKLLINEGCPYKCTYCTEKLAFPPYRSVSEERLVDVCRVLPREENRIILLGDCLGRYGMDIGSSLPKLIRRLHCECPETVYALGNLHPIDFNHFYDDMAEFLDHSWITHITMAIQSASDKILSAMRRGYTKKDLDRAFGLLMDRGFKTFDTHIIVGFPGETEVDFQMTLEFLIRYGPTYALVSKYYDTPNAESSKMNNKVDEDTITRRLELIAKEMDQIGMVYNIEGAGVMQDRLSRINRSQ